MRRAAALLAAAALALAGCGSSPESEVRSTVQDFLNAFAGGDGAKACSLLTDNARQRFAAHLQPLTGTNDCVKAMVAIKAAAGPAVMGALKRSRISDVRVRGDRATAKVTSGSGSRIAFLLKQRGNWRLVEVPGIK